MMQQGNSKAPDPLQESVQQTFMRTDRRFLIVELLASILVFASVGTILYGLAGSIATLASGEFGPAFLQRQHLVLIAKATFVWAVLGTVVGLLAGVSRARMTTPGMPAPLRLAAPLFALAVGLGILGPLAIGLWLHPLLQTGNTFVVRSSLIRASLCGLAGFMATRATIQVAEWIHLRIAEPRTQRTRDRLERFFSIRDRK